METITMTVHEALAELKVLGSRIEKEMGKNAFAFANKHSNDKIKGKTIDQMSQEIRSSYQSVRDLINRRNAIKRAVIKSNAETTFLVGDNLYSVAEAIDMKNVGIDLLMQIKNRLENDFNYAVSVAERENGKDLESRADAYVASLFSGSTKNNLSEDAKNARDAFIASQKYDVIDPLGITTKVKEIEDEISEFITKVDSAISVSNALTTIFVEY